MARMLKEPQTGKQVWWVDVCPKHKAKPSPFSSLVERCCTNCIYSKSSEKETYCRYPEEQTDKTN